MMVLWLLVLAGLAWLVWWFLGRDGWRLPSGAGRGETALDILKRRYARGEITKEEYERMKQDLD
jgi:putative membrane protein